jgi:hypothetical protein
MVHYTPPGALVKDDGNNDPRNLEPPKRQEATIALLNAEAAEVSGRSQGASWGSDAPLVLVPHPEAILAVGRFRL